MKRILFFVAAVLGIVPLPVAASTLDVVNAAAPAVNCPYKTNCIVVVTDSIGKFTPPGDSDGAMLQSRTYLGEAPAPLAGKMGYVYRVVLTEAKAAAATNCVTALRIDFGPIVKGPYAASGGTQDVFVVTSGGLGSVGIASATRTGDTITFNFDSGGVCPGQTSYFFGLTSASTTPSPGVATLSYSLGGTATTADRVP